MKSSNTKKFGLITLITSASFIALVGVFNFIVDPYNKFGNNTLGVYISCEREFKATEIRKHLDDYDLLVLGNSKAAMIDTQAIPTHKTFNAAFGGGRVSEIYQFIEQHIHQPKLLIIGLDILEAAPESSLPSQPNTLTDYLIGLKTTEYSFKTIAKYYQKAPTGLNQDGSFNTQRWFNKHEVDNPGLTQYAINNIIEGFSSVKLTADDMFYYHKLKNLLDSRNIPYITYIHPLHEAVVQSLKSPQTNDELTKFMTALNAIFPNTIDLSDSAYSTPSSFFKTDPLHYKPQVGAHFINQKLLTQKQ